MFKSGGKIGGAARLPRPSSDRRVGTQTGFSGGCSHPVGSQ
jgi:hypothetical protein